MNPFKSLALVSALLLAGGIAFAGPQNHSAGVGPQVKNEQAENNNNSKPSSHGKVFEQEGTVSEVTGTQLVLLHKVNGKPESMRFEVNSSTKKEGKIGTGAPVTVYYKSAGNHEPVATTVKANTWKE